MSGLFSASERGLAVFVNQGVGHVGGLLEESTSVASARNAAREATGADFGEAGLADLVGLARESTVFVRSVYVDLVGGEQAAEATLVPGAFDPMLFAGAGAACLHPQMLGPGLTPEQIAEMTPEEIREFYEDRVLCMIGTTDEAWRPEEGFDANRETVSAVVEFYGDLYRSDPDTYLWGGMASMIWASLYAGVQDLNDSEKIGVILDKVGEIERLTPGGTPLGPLTELTGEQLAQEMGWYEVRLLEMQKEVFLDQAVSHEAYRDGGLAAVEKLLQDDPHNYGPQTLLAWQQIDEGRRTGDRSLVEQGNEALLYREQHMVLQDDYDDMRNRRPPVGEAITYLMTMTGAPSIPGAVGYAELNPVTVGTSVTFPVPFAPDIRVGTEVITPLPDGNIANPDSRWELIEEDTLPAYLELAENPDDVLAIIDVPVEERASEYRIIWQLDDIIDRFGVGASVELVD